VIFLPFATNHRFISFTLYCIGEYTEEMDIEIPSHFLRLCGIRDISAKELPETTVQLVWMGAHDIIIDRGFEVGVSIQLALFTQRRTVILSLTTYSR
jgi:hypothetical protein